MGKKVARKCNNRVLVELIKYLYHHRYCSRVDFCIEEDEGPDGHQINVFVYPDNIEALFSFYRLTEEERRVVRWSVSLISEGITFQKQFAAVVDEEVRRDHV